MRLKRFSIFSSPSSSPLEDYFNHELNARIMKKVAEKCYLPANQIMLELLEKFPEFYVTFSLTGVFIEQCKNFAPEILDSFAALSKTGKVEFLSETYYHSLASLFSTAAEFIEQISLHQQTISELATHSSIF
ncbi:MAG: hypothetical protein QXN01_01550, partial [Candidatus Anstonellales archaeon]